MYFALKEIPETAGIPTEEILITVTETEKAEKRLGASR